MKQIIKNGISLVFWLVMFLWNAWGVSNLEVLEILRVMAAIMMGVCALFMVANLYRIINYYAENRGVYGVEKQ